ncbi:MAG TPA: GNAT family N-acetyltransferase [Flavobacterium sp.]|jgi:GNAT superfamily N-acetyltransferase
MISCIRTTSEHIDFRHLVAQLDAVLQILDGDEHSFYAQYNKIDRIRYAVVAFDENEAAGCGAIKQYSEDTAEVKRMFVAPEFRNKGIASVLLSELEKWAGELGFKRCILETGIKQHEAIALYQKNGYTMIPNFGQYENAVNSVCFEKSL